MRIPSGVTDQYLYFVAVDATDLITREPGLSSFTVRRSRNGGASAAYTTPTINETDSSNMPGVYELLLDEDMTIDSGDDSQEVCLHITHAGMAPVTRVFELYRREVTAGETLTVASGVGSANAVQVSGDATAADTLELFAEALDQSTGQLDSGSFAAGAITAAGIAPDAIGASELAADAASEIATAVWAAVTRTLSAIDEDSTTLDLDATIRAAVGLASANLDTQIDALPTTAEVNAEVDQALADYDGPTYAELLNLTRLGLRKDSALATDLSALITTLNADLGSGGGAYANTTDAQEAIRDRGDAAWATATGFSTHSAADVWSVGTRVLTAGTNIQLPANGLANVTAWTVAITGDVTGNLSGSVGSVTGAVGSVTGNVGGNVTGSVGSLATQAKADVNAEVDGAIETYHLDHLLAATYDPAAKPGAADALLNEIIESDAGVSRFTANALELAPTDGAAPTVGDIADAVLDEALSGHTTAGTLGKAVSDALADTNELQGDWADGGRLDLILDARASQVSVDDLPTNVELATALAAADDAVLAAIAALNNLSAAQVNAEVVDALATDTYGEPGQGAPAATTSLAAKLNYLYKAWRNKSTATASQQSLYNDAGDTIDQKATLADDDTIFTRGEMGTGA